MSLDRSGIYNEETRVTLEVLIDASSLLLN